MSIPIADSADRPKRRGVGRGSSFFLIDRKTWNKLWACDTKNRLNLICAFLVLSAGTGADHRLTKWSARSCEKYLGMGKPRAKIAIDELNRLKIISVQGTRERPLYEMAPITQAAEPIYLPNQLITGLASEVPILRRLRETGDAMLVRMLIDLYGLMQIDATSGVPLSAFRGFAKSEECPQIRLTDIGANTVWALRPGAWRRVAGEWSRSQTAKSDCDTFWPRFQILETVGAVWTENWLFDGEALDDEPLYPIASPYDDQNAGGGVASASQDAIKELLKDSQYLISRYPEHRLVILPRHHRAPFLHGVLRLRVEADSPGRRQAYARRMSAIEGWEKAYREMLELSRRDCFDCPIRWHGIDPDN